MGEEKKPTIYEKLLAVRKTVLSLAKDGKGEQYDYVSSGQVLGSIREAMDEQGLLLLPRVSDVEMHIIPRENKAPAIFTETHMVFTWVNADNPEEKLEFPWYAQGGDYGIAGVGVGKCYTYAEKYFLLKTFQIATDADDPDADQRNGTKEAVDKFQTETKPPPKEEKDYKITEKQVKMIKAIAINTWGSEDMSNTFREVANAMKPFNKKKVEDLTKSEMDKLIEYMKRTQKEIEKANE